MEHMVVKNDLKGTTCSASRVSVRKRTPLGDNKRTPYLRLDHEQRVCEHVLLRLSFTPSEQTRRRHTSSAID